MKLKSLVASVVALSMALVMTGCGETTTNDTTKTDASSSSKVYKIGMLQLVQHEALDAASKGFQDKLTELLGEGNVEFDLQNAAGDSATCSTIANQFVSSNVDLIFANATPALQACSAATDSIPIVGTSVTDYATALDIDDWTGKTGKNITGTSDLAPLADQAAMFKELLPEAKTVGILYCSSEANSKYQADVVKEELTKLGLEVKDYTFADSNDIATVVTTACDEVDALYVPTDNTAASNTEIIDNIAAPKNIPIIAGESGICEGCGIATLSISYYSLGEVTAQMAYDILVNGKDPASMDVQFATDLTKKYVASRCEAIGISIPEVYEELK